MWLELSRSSTAQTFLRYVTIRTTGPTQGPRRARGSHGVQEVAHVAHHPTYPKKVKTVGYRRSAAQLVSFLEKGHILINKEMGILDTGANQSDEHRICKFIGI